MGIQSVVVKVNSVNQQVMFNPVLQAYMAVLPTQVAPFVVEIDAIDLSMATVSMITFVTDATQGELVKFAILSTTGNPVCGVQVQADYANPSGGTNFGRAEVQGTDSTGVAYLHLAAGVYNLTVTYAGYSTKILNHFQVLTGINVFDDASGTLPNTHVVNDASGNPIEAVNVKIEDLTLPSATRLVAVRQTDVLGTWSATLPEARPLAITFDKMGLDFQKVQVQNA